MCGCRSFRPTQSHERAGFILLWTSGMSIRNIAVRSGTSVTTVYRWVRRWQREGHVNFRPRNSRPVIAATSLPQKDLSHRGEYNVQPFTASSVASYSPVTSSASCPKRRSPCSECGTLVPLPSHYLHIGAALQNENLSNSYLKNTETKGKNKSERHTD